MIDAARRGADIGGLLLFEIALLPKEGRSKLLAYLEVKHLYDCQDHLGWRRSS